MQKLWRVEFRAHFGTLEIVNTLHVEENAPGLPANDATDVAGQVNSHLQAAYRNMLSTAYTLDEIVAVSQPLVYGSEEVPTAGTVVVGQPGAYEPSDDDLPPRICTMILWKTAAHGRRFTGRFYCPPCEGKTSIQDDLIAAASAYGTGVAAFRDQVDGQPLTADLSFVVYSRRLHALNEPVYTFPITAGIWRRKLAYLSSRDK